MLAKVSIIIPTYNRKASYLREAVESALDQTYPNLEIIVINDGSTTSRPREVLEPYMSRIRYVEQENRGCAGAKNRGLALATGDYVTNLDDDDRIHPEKIARQIDRFQKQPGLGLVATGVNFIDALGQVTSRYIPPRFSRSTQVLQLLRRCLLIQSRSVRHK